MQLTPDAPARWSDPLVVDREWWGVIMASRETTGTLLPGESERRAQRRWWRYNVAASRGAGGCGIHPSVVGDRFGTAEHAGEVDRDVWGRREWPGGCGTAVVT